MRSREVRFCVRPPSTVAVHRILNLPLSSNFVRPFFVSGRVNPWELPVASVNSRFPMTALLNLSPTRP